MAGHDGDGEKKERRLRWEPGLDHARRPVLGKGADFISRAKGSCWRVLAPDFCSTLAAGGELQQGECGSGEGPPGGAAAARGALGVHIT